MITIYQSNFTLCFWLFFSVCFHHFFSFFQLLIFVLYWFFLRCFFTQYLPFSLNSFINCLVINSSVFLDLQMGFFLGVVLFMHYFAPPFQLSLFFMANLPHYLIFYQSVSFSIINQFFPTIFFYRLLKNFFRLFKNSKLNHFFFFNLNQPNREVIHRSRDSCFMNFNPSSLSLFNHQL